MLLSTMHFPRCLIFTIPKITIPVRENKDSHLFSFSIIANCCPQGNGQIIAIKWAENKGNGESKIESRKMKTLNKSGGEISDMC